MPSRRHPSCNFSALNSCRSVRELFFLWRRSLRLRRGFPSLLPVNEGNSDTSLLVVSSSASLASSSPVALDQLSLSRVALSNKTYESKGRLFASFCKLCYLDPFTASPVVVADFLL